MIKLLFDQNLSPKLVISFDDSMHLQDLGLDSSDDLSVWEFAKKEGFTIAGMVMFGKYLSITDEECCPKFFPDFREIMSICVKSTGKDIGQGK